MSRCSSSNKLFVKIDISWTQTLVVGMSDYHDLTHKNHFYEDKLLKMGGEIQFTLI